MLSSSLLFSSSSDSNKRARSAEASESVIKRLRSGNSSSSSPSEINDYNDIIATPKFRMFHEFLSSPHIGALGGYATVLPSLDLAICNVDSRGLNKVMTDYGDIVKANQWLALYLCRCG